MTHPDDRDPLDAEAVRLGRPLSTTVDVRPLAELGRVSGPDAVLAEARAVLARAAARDANAEGDHALERGLAVARPAPASVAALAVVLALVVLLLVALASADPLVRTRARRSVRAAAQTVALY